MPVQWDNETALPARGRVVWDDEPQPQSSSSVIGAAGRGALQGLTMGFADELGGAGTAVIQGLTNLLPKGAREALDLVEASPGAAYTSSRDDARADDEAAKAEHGFAYGAGNVAGSVLSPINKMLAPLKAARGAGALAKAGAAAVNGGLQGVVQGVGSSTAEDLTGVGADALAAGATGAALAGGLSGLGTGLKTAAPALRRAAGSLAAKAPGKMLADYRALGSPEAAIEQGRHLLDRGLVQFGDSAENIAQRLGPARKQALTTLTSAIRGLDETGAPAPTALEMARRIHREVVQPLAKYPANDDVVHHLNDQLEGLVRKFGDDPIPFSEVEAIKRSYDRFLKWEASTPTPVQEAMQHFRHVIKDSTEVAAQHAGPSAASRFIKAKDVYGLIAPAEEASSDYLLRQAANRKISPSDYIAGASKMASDGDPVVAGVTAWVHKQLRERGNASAAVVADALAKGLEAAPQAFGRFGPLLQRAAQASPRALVALHQALIDREPEYKQMMEEE